MYGSWEHDNELSCTIKGAEFLDQLNGYQHHGVSYKYPVLYDLIIFRYTAVHMKHKPTFSATANNVLRSRQNGH